MINTETPEPSKSALKFGLGPHSGKSVNWVGVHDYTYLAELLEDPHFGDFEGGEQFRREIMDVNYRLGSFVPAVSCTYPHCGALAHYTVPNLKYRTNKEPALLLDSVDFNNTPFACSNPDHVHNYLRSQSYFPSGDTLVPSGLDLSERSQLPVALLISFRIMSEGLFTENNPACNPKVVEDVRTHLLRCAGFKDAVRIGPNLDKFVSGLTTRTPKNLALLVG